MLTVHWVKDVDGEWLPLETVDLSEVRGAGVYVIWHEGNPSGTVRIGQGNIADQLIEERTNREVLLYAKLGKLRVTWALIPQAQRNGVVRYLSERLSPLTGHALPLTMSIAVNLPGTE